MAKLAPMARGVTYLFRGARIGNSNLAGLGAAIVAYRLVSRKKPKALLYSRKLKPGQGLRVVRPDIGEAIEIRAGE